MIKAIKHGIIGVVIGLAITGFIAFVDPSEWSLQRVMVFVGHASFWGPFGTALAMRKAIT